MTQNFSLSMMLFPKDRFVELAHFGLEILNLAVRGNRTLPDRHTRTGGDVSPRHLYPS